MLVSLYQKLFKKTVIANENQTDLSLGYTHISFDASVMPNGHIGIGMHDITNKVKKNIVVEKLVDSALQKAKWLH